MKMMLWGKEDVVKKFKEGLKPWVAKWPLACLFPYPKIVGCAKIVQGPEEKAAREFGLY